MNPNEVLIELRNVQEKYKNVSTDFFQIRVSDMARDAADAIEELQSFTKLICSLSTCNECGHKECTYRPALGDTVRYNCPLFLDMEAFQKNKEGAKI